MKGNLKQMAEFSPYIYHNYRGEITQPGGIMIHLVIFHIRREFVSRLAHGHRNMSNAEM